MQQSHARDEGTCKERMNFGDSNSLFLGWGLRLRVYGVNLGFSVHGLGLR